MNTFGRVKPWLRAILDGAGYEKWSIHPGPELPDEPDGSVVCTRYGGSGTEVDGAMDGKSWQFRVIGMQNDYESAEGVADAIDIAALSWFSADMGGVWVTSIERVGGAPAALMTDDAERTHFVCSYTASVELALTN